MENILVIQTAFLGDVILATSLVEKIKDHFPDAKIDFIIRKGYESIFDLHPKIHKVIAFDKDNNKFRNLYSLLKRVRYFKYDLVINIQRYLTTGLITVLTRSRLRVGFNKNPLSFLFDKKVKHTFDGSHEIVRNHKLIEWFTDKEPARPRLYPSRFNIENIKPFTQKPYICIAPASVWYTKQFPPERWVQLIDQIKNKCAIYLLGSSDDYQLGAQIQDKLSRKVENLCGKLNLLDTAALMKDAVLNLVNDSAPLHIASAMNAPVIIFYLSTLPSFGYGPLSEDAQIIEVSENLKCRPCGLHGRMSCPEGHFDCAYKIDLNLVLVEIEKRLENA